MIPTNKNKINELPVQFFIMELITARFLDWNTIPALCKINQNESIHPLLSPIYTRTVKFIYWVYIFLHGTAKGLTKIISETWKGIVSFHYWIIWKNEQSDLIWVFGRIIILSVLPVFRNKSGTDFMIYE